MVIVSPWRCFRIDKARRLCGINCLIDTLLYVLLAKRLNRAISKPFKPDGLVGIVMFLAGSSASG